MKKLLYGMVLQIEILMFLKTDKFNILRDNADKHLAFGIGDILVLENQLL